MRDAIALRLVLAAMLALCASSARGQLMTAEQVAAIRSRLSGTPSAKFPERINMRAASTRRVTTSRPILRTHRSDTEKGEMRTCNSPG